MRTMPATDDTMPERVARPSAACSLCGLPAGNVLRPIVLAMMLGCHAGERRCADVPNGAVPRPAGAYTCQWQRAQMQAAEADDYVIYNHGWRGRTAVLSPSGERQLKELSRRMLVEPGIVVIAPPPDTLDSEEAAALVEQRREVVVQRLASAGVEEADELVRIGDPLAEPLYGEEAARLGTNRLSGRAVGAGFGAGGIGGGGMGGSGFSTSNTVGGGFFGGGFF